MAANKPCPDRDPLKEEVDELVCDGWVLPEFADEFLEQVRKDLAALRGK